MPDDDLSIPEFLLRSTEERLAMEAKHAEERTTHTSDGPVLRSGFSAPKRRRHRDGPHSEQDPRNVFRAVKTVLPAKGL